MTIQLSPNLNLPLPNGTSEDLRFQDIVAIKDALIILDQKINRQIADNPTKPPSYTLTVDSVVPNENGLVDYIINITTYGVAGGTTINLVEDTDAFTGFEKAVEDTDFTITPTSVVLVGDKRNGATATVTIETNLNSARKQVILKVDQPALTWDTVDTGQIFISKYYDLPTLNLNTSVYGDGKYIAYAPNSRLASYSTDGINWRNIDTYSDNFSNVIFGNGAFVGFDRASGQSVTSTDGTNWQRGANGLDNQGGNITDWNIIFGNGLFVATPVIVGGSDIVRVSTGDDNWAEYTLPNSGEWTIYPIANNEFAGFGKWSVYAFTTTDFNTYVAQPLMAPNAGNYLVSTGLIGGSLKYIAVNNTTTTYTSNDGINWTQRELIRAAVWSDVCYGGGKFVAISGTPNAQNTGSEAMYSVDGINWIHFSIQPTDIWTTVLYDGVKFIAHGYSQNRGSSVETLNI